MIAQDRDWGKDFFRPWKLSGPKRWTKQKGFIL